MGEDICSIIEAKGGCDFDAPPYRVSDYLTPEERVRLLTAIARSAAGKAIVCNAARTAIEKYAPRKSSRSSSSSGVVGAIVSLIGANEPSSRGRDSISAFDKAQAILTFVQQDVGYVPDPDGEWYQGVRYTLEHGGDCEDMAVLFVAMAACVDIQAKLIWLEQPKARLNHVTTKVLVNDPGGLFRKSSGDSQWMWAEPTIRKAKVGQHPYDAAKWHGSANRLGF